MGRSTTAADCRKIVAMPLITFQCSKDDGKSTQVKRPAARLEEGSQATAFAPARRAVWAATGDAILHLLQYSQENHEMTAETELLLFEASRSQLVRKKTQPALAGDKRGICDRLFDSTAVYQDAEPNLVPKLVKSLNAFAVADWVADLTSMIDIDRGTAHSRLGKSNENSRLSGRRGQQVWHQPMNRFPVLANDQSSTIGQRPS